MSTRPTSASIPDELWASVEARIAAQEAPEKKGGRPASYLLSGVLRCGECGGPLTVINGKQSYDPIKVYTCCRRRDRGGTVCPSTLRREVGQVDTAVLDWVRREVLTEEYVAAIITEARRRVVERASTQTADIEQLEKQAAKLRAEVDKFAELAPEARAVFFAKVSERQRGLTALETRLRTAKTVPAAMDLELRRLEREARQRLDELKTTMDREPFEARAFMRALFPDGLRATPTDRPEGRGMLLEGMAAPGRAFGVRVGNSASPAGFGTLRHVDGWGGEQDGVGDEGERMGVAA